MQLTEAGQICILARVCNLAEMNRADIETNGAWSKMKGMKVCYKTTQNDIREGVRGKSKLHTEGEGQVFPYARTV